MKNYNLNDLKEFAEFDGIRVCTQKQEAQDWGKWRCCNLVSVTVYEDVAEYANIHCFDIADTDEYLADIKDCFNPEELEIISDFLNGKSKKMIELTVEYETYIAEYIYPDGENIQKLLKDGIDFLCSDFRKWEFYKD